MTEIPEHLRKRAEAARAKAEAEKGAAEAPAEPVAAAASDAPADPAESRIPAHLLERSRAAKAKAEGAEAGRRRLGRRRRSRSPSEVAAVDRCRPRRRPVASRSVPAPAVTPSGC